MRGCSGRTPRRGSSSRPSRRRTGRPPAGGWSAPRRKKPGSSGWRSSSRTRPAGGGSRSSRPGSRPGDGRRTTRGGPMPIAIVEERPDSADAVRLVTELDEHLNAQPYTQESRHAFSIDKLVREGVAFFVTRYAGEPAGCGGLKLFGTEYGEVKRMYVRPAYRGLGLGKAMLDRLAEYARGRQVRVLRLETGIYQTEAIGLYERYGFQRRPPFGEYKDDPMSVYFEKSIAGS